MRHCETRRRRARRTVPKQCVADWGMHKAATAGKDAREGDLGAQLAELVKNPWARLLGARGGVACELEPAQKRIR